MLKYEESLLELMNLLFASAISAYGGFVLNFLPAVRAYFIVFESVLHPVFLHRYYTLEQLHFGTGCKFYAMDHISARIFDYEIFSFPEKTDGDS